MGADLQKAPWAQGSGVSQVKGRMKEKTRCGTPTQSDFILILLLPFIQRRFYFLKAKCLISFTRVLFFSQRGPGVAARQGQ